MTEHLIWLHGLCTSDTALQGGVLLGLFTAGAAGSIAHCGPMCGGFVLGQMSERMARLPPQRLCERQRIGNALLLPYHLGRLTTYAGLGALAAASAAAFEQVAWLGRLSGVLLGLAALMFLGHALGWALPFIGKIDRAPRFWSRLIGAFTRRIARGSVFGEYLLGVALGFLPCGLLYAAIAAAAASARPATGAAGMVAFGLGTAPMLMLIAVVGYSAGRRWNRSISVVAPTFMVLNAVLLLFLAWQKLT